MARRKSKPANPLQPTRRASPWLIWIALATITVLAFRDVTRCEFINYDDNLYVTSNAAVQRGLAWPSVRWAFTTLHAGYWIPLTWLSLMLDVELHGMNAGGFHLTNLVLHVMGVLALCAALKRATGSTMASALAAALYAVHPLRVQSVAWVAERKDMLAAFMGFISLALYCRYVFSRSGAAYVGALATYALSLMAKPVLLPWAFLLLLMDYWPLARFQNREQASPAPSPQPGTARLLLEKVPFLALAIVAAIVTFIAQQKMGVIRSVSEYGWGHRLGHAVVSYAAYLLKMVRFDDLAIFYPMPRRIAPAWIALSGAAIAIITASVIRLRRSRPWLLTGWLWFLAALFPTIGLVQTPAIVLFRYHPSSSPLEEPVYNIDVPWPDDAPIVRAHDLDAQSNARLFEYYARQSSTRRVYRFDRADFTLKYLGTVKDLHNGAVPGQ